MAQDLEATERVASRFAPHYAAMYGRAGNRAWERARSVAVKLLVVNGNTTQAVADSIVAEARRVAAPGTEVAGVTARFGVGIVATEAGNAIAAHAVLDLLAAHMDGHDAAILGISFDTGLAAARRLSTIPVIGMTEASLMTAAVSCGALPSLPSGRPAGECIST